jgi:hypothetical protein
MKLKIGAAFLLVLIAMFGFAQNQSTSTRSDRGVKFVEKPNKVGRLGNVDVWIGIFHDSEDNMMGLRSMVTQK